MDTAEVLDLIKRVSEEVIEPRFRSLRADQIIEKAPGDLVTVADREAEIAITKELQQRIPGCVVVGEEASFADASLLKDLGSVEHLFVVDPVDGTANFARGSEKHAVMIAEVRNGETSRSWIYQPALGKAFVAEKGAGVWLNGEPLRGAEVAERPYIGASSRKKLIGWTDDGALAPMRRSQWCCGVDYPMVATGEIDFLIYVKNKPWDHIPGALLLSELGGGVITRSGEPYTIATSEPGILAYRTNEVRETVFPRWPEL